MKLEQLISKIIAYLSHHPFTIISYLLYCWFWWSLHELYSRIDKPKCDFTPIGMLFISFLFALVMFLLLILSKKHKSFYGAMIFIIVAQFILLYS
jgi:hypothetical protein